MPLRSFPWLAVLLLIASPLWAQPASPVVTFDASVPVPGVGAAQPCRENPTVLERAWQQAWSGRARTAATSATRIDLAARGLEFRQSTEQETPRRRPKAIEYSEGYELRRKIHRYASIATLPLFVTEYALGQSLFNNPSGGKRGAHGAVATGIAGVFAVNSVTGVWNLKEGWKDPNGRGRRTLHGVLMLIADAGFLATAALAPEGEHGGEGRTFVNEGPGHSRSTHRAVAISSMGVAAVSYLTMLLWRP